MLSIRLKNETRKPYPEVRDTICRSLVGSRGFIENDIMVSDDMKEDNIVLLTLGDVINPDDLEFEAIVEKLEV